MSQTLNIAAILFRNLGEALLKAAAEIDNGDQPKTIATTITEVPEKLLSTAPPLPKLVSQYPYKANEKVLVLFKGASIPIRCTILECISRDAFIVYPQGAPKEKSRQVSREQIISLDPDR